MDMLEDTHQLALCTSSFLHLGEGVRATLVSGTHVDYTVRQLTR